MGNSMEEITNRVREQCGDKGVKRLNTAVNYKPPVNPCKDCNQLFCETCEFYDILNMPSRKAYSYDYPHTEQKK